MSRRRSIGSLGPDHARFGRRAARSQGVTSSRRLDWPEHVGTPRLRASVSAHWRNLGESVKNTPVYAASQMSQLRKSSSAASHTRG
jgi:hypothetical protein